MTTLGGAFIFQMEAIGFLDFSRVEISEKKEEAEKEPSLEALQSLTPYPFAGMDMPFNKFNSDAN